MFLVYKGEGIKGNKGGYKVYMGLQWVTWGYKRLQGVTRVTRGDRG